MIQVLVEFENWQVGTGIQWENHFMVRTGVNRTMVEDAPLTATHSITSAYLGSITIVLKLPFTSAASTKGLHRYRGLGAPGLVGVGGGRVSVDGKLAEVGVVDRLGARGLRCMERLH